ncbi:flagellar biosynthesis protein FlhF [Salinicola sp. LHM]|uniref:flagellar biosynthesis protein FlhF n=1 Tax=Salinicola sp. LHM TaxID=3065298 RepID=UPI002ACE5AAA|nr:flagellar biosynthesis protein FlhF [Salinicola sp. LHM]WQH32438.1 flagellar biosynthesis protein FlhF [Salinicola sp. LHM]
MGVQRFTASNSREAMRQVRAALGDQVLILSNRSVEGGVEIIAMPEQEHEQTLSSLESPAAEAPAAEAPAPAPTPNPTLETLQALNRQLLEDVRAMLGGGMASSQSDAASLTTALRQRLIQAGFSASLADEVIQDPPEELRDEQPESPAAKAWLVRQLRARLSLLDDEEALFESGGVFALVGPTGVGKTTTTAKLASRYVMRHGPKDVALVTTDSYRIGAAEQLRIYARLLGSEVHALEENGNLGDLLTRLTQPRRALLSRSGGKKLTVIDTVGMSQRDQRLVGEIARLGAGPAPARRVLVLNAASHGDTLAQVIEAWQQASQEAGEPLWGCILTKLDEAARLGNVLDVVIRHRLRLCYVSRGQRVPEDLELVDADALLDEALALAGDSPFVSEAAATVPPQQARQQALSRGVLRQRDALVTTLDTLRQHNLGMTLLEQIWRRAKRSTQAGSDEFARLMAGATQQSLLSAADVPHALYWSKTTSVSGAEQAMPLVSLDHHGMPQPLTWPRHRLPAGSAEQFRWADDLGAGWHLLAQLPAVADLECFEAAGRGWLAAVTGARRIRHAGEWLPLSRAMTLGEAVEPQPLRHQGRAATLHLTRLETSVSQRRQDAYSLPVVAWYGEIRDADDGRRLARRYWLSSSQAGLDIASRLPPAVMVETLPGLTRQADQAMQERGLVKDREQRWQLASTLAALAVRLSAEEAGWAMDVRARLSGIAQRRCGRRPKALMEALMDTLSAHDALMGLDASGRVQAA